MSSYSESGSSYSSSEEANDPVMKRKRQSNESENININGDNNGNKEKWLQTFYTWTPSAISLQGRKSGEALESQIFSHDGLNWRLSLFPRGYDNESSDYFSLFLELVTPAISLGCEKIQGKFAFYIRNEKGEYTHRMSGEHTFTNDDRMAGFSRYLRRKDMVYGFHGVMCHVRAERIGVSEEPNEQMRNNINFKPRIRSLSVMQHNNENHHTNRRSSINTTRTSSIMQAAEVLVNTRLKISNDLDMLFNNEKFSDVILVTAGRQFHAHKAILSARSPVFLAMFESDKDDISSNKVKISDIYDEVFEEILRFMYTGRVNNIEDTTCELLIAAGRYALDDLKNLCEKALIRRLNVENVANIFILADRHNANELKTKTIRFINENAKEVIQTGGYRLIVDSHLHLIEELYRHEHLI